MLKHLQAREDWSEKSLGAKGFTLIELLVVIIILGVLAAVAIFAVGSINSRAKANACKTEKSTLETADEAYNAQADVYASSVDYLDGVTASNGSDGQPITAQLKKAPIYWKIVSPFDGTVTASGTLPSGCP